ncbi:strawberry notch C-terminal domain-containing protein [Nostoc sp. JL31]|uniref:strawberry notch C-terminal domain-containing protein n=1 Tax=Nostoc sp. JL31 TaxID=2815395 RepID=UPI0025FDCE26|nr:strawberry notch C-terminal domain-containing protein [Nostoc sp. JL31]
MVIAILMACDPLRQFLNRLLALRIDMQNVIFERFELLLSQQIEAAIVAGDGCRDFTG